MASIFLPLILTQKTVDNPAKLLSFKRNKLNKLAACKQQQSRYPLEASCISYNCNDASLNLRHYTKCTTRLSVHRIRFSYPCFVKTTVPETIRKQTFFFFFFFLPPCCRRKENNPSGKSQWKSLECSVHSLTFQFYNSVSDNLKIHISH